MWKMPWKKKPKPERAAPVETAEEHRQRVRAQREIQNFWAYTGDKQAPIEYDE